MNRAGFCAYLVSSGVNIRYLTGFRGTFGYLLVAAGKYYLLTDTRYILKAEKTTRVADIVAVTGENRFRRVSELLLDHGIKEVAFEQPWLTHEDYLKLRGDLRKIKLLDGRALVESLRLCKDESEIRAIREACRVLDHGFKFLLDTVRPGMTEKQLQTKLSVFLFSCGIESLAFEPIVASGPVAAAPHAESTNRKIRTGDFVLADFGVCIGGYNSDMTRTVFVGRASIEERNVYKAVLKAHQAACLQARAGIKAAILFKTAMSVLRKHGLQEHFTHGLGHGIGMEVHENPRIASSSANRLRTGMVFTIEPGVYFRNRFGVRIEDTGVLMNRGFVPLTHSPRQLIEIKRRR